MWDSPLYAKSLFPVASLALYVLNHLVMTGCLITFALKFFNGMCHLTW